MKRRTWWIVSGAAAGVVVIAVLVWLLVPRPAGAEDQALAYLRALADGDIAAVQATGLEVSEAAASAFLAADGRISEGKVESADQGGATTTVRVSYLLGDERFETDIDMRSEGERWVPDVSTALGTVRTEHAAAIGDAILPAGETVPLLPAEYDLVAAPSQFLDGSALIRVAAGSAQDVALDAALRPEATESAQTQLDEYLAECTQQAPEEPPSCGIAIPWAADFASVSDIRYRIEKAPVLVLTPTTFRADDGVLVATVTGTGHDGAESTLSYRTENWMLRGDVSFTADDIVLSVW